MPIDRLHIESAPKLQDATMVLAFSGWMDGGDVSTGTVTKLLEHLNAARIGRIDPEGFYIYNFPGAMEISALFRPHVRYEDGKIVQYEPTTNEFHADAGRNLVLFNGKEPNLLWENFADCVFELAHKVGVTRMIFIGSFGGSVPHTRQPRLFASVSEDSLKPMLEKFGARLTDYEGPASFATYLMTRSGKHGIKMASLVAEIPGYIQGVNPLSIEAVTRRLATLLGLPIDLASFRVASDEWESQVSAMVRKDSKLAAHIRKLEEEYDQELIEKSEEESDKGQGTRDKGA